MDRSRSSAQSVLRVLYVQASLQGGAPWGFSLKGGLEHGEPLTISKIEEGGKAEALESKLQVGDEVVKINDMDLSSSRSEAISLVTGSYKKLHLTVRRVKLVPSTLFHDNIEISREENITVHESRGFHEQGVFIKKDLDESLSCKPTSLDTITHNLSPACSGGEPKLRISRQNEPVTRPHSWHSTKLLESLPNPSMMQISQGTIGSPWHQAYHSSSSTSDLSSYDHGFLRRSPDQYSSRGSMESLDHTSPAYHQCHHLSPAKSTNCIDQLAHLHSKRDSAYSSFSTNSSIPEYHPTVFSKERSYSMESMHPRSNLQEGIKHADIRYIKTVYDAQSGVSEEYEVNSSSVKNRNYSRLSSNNRNTGGPVNRVEQARVFSESDSLERGPPMPPTRSDSFAVTRHHERPSSWSSTDQNQSFKTHPKVVGSHLVSGTCNMGHQLKPIFGEGHLHTVLEKSPESSPLTKPKQMYSQAPQPGQPMLPTGIYPVPSPEPHFAIAPPPPKNNNGRLYPALAKEGAYSPVKKVASSLQFDNNGKDCQNHHSSCTVLYPTNVPTKDRDKKHEGPTSFAHYKLHFSVDPEIPKGSSTTVDNDPNVFQANQFYHNDEHIKNGSKNQAQIHTEKQSNGELRESLVSVESRTVSMAPLQHEWNEIKSKLEISSPVINMDSYRKQNSIDTPKEKQWGNLHNATPSSNNRIEDRPRRQGSDHRNKLDSQSFTKLIEDEDASLLFYNNHLKSEEPSSPSQTKNFEFARRRLSSSSLQSSHSVPYAKTDINKTRSSVLDKISKIEQREQESQRSHVSTSNLYGHQVGQVAKGSNNRGSVNSIEEIRNRFNSQEQNQCSERRRLSSSQSTEKVTGVQQLKRAGSVYSVRSGDSVKQGVLSQVDKMQQCKHEQHVVQALPDDDRNTDAQTMPNKDNHWQSAPQDTLGFNRAYRNSIKDAQSKVLEATSYRRKDLEFSPPQYKKEWKNLKRPTSALLQGKTSPVSPHAPKERHNITPTDNCAKDFQSQESPGISNPVSRIGARRRLTIEQKKRSYSEPEKMNEVGASENEPLSLNVKIMGHNENTVADKRRIFERDGKSCSTVNLSKPELKQLQQNALADYIERKTGRRPPSQEAGFLKERSQSTYFSGSMMDSQSISSTSSINSLQEHLSYRTRDTKEMLSKTGRVSSTLPPGLTGLFDLVNLEQDTDHQETRSRSSSFAYQRLLDYRTKTEFSMSTQADKHREFNSSKPVEFGQNAASEKPSKSASADDLLDTSQQTVALHVRSRSSPAGDKKSQDIMMRQDINVKSTSFASGFSVSKSRDENQITKRSFHSTLQSHPDHTGAAVEKLLHNTSITGSQSAVQTDIQKHNRTQSLAPTFAHSQSHESKPITLPLASHISPSKPTQVSISPHTSYDFVTAEDYLYAGKREKSWVPPALNKADSPTVPTSHDYKSLEDPSDQLRVKKCAPPQRPPPPKIKCTAAVSEVPASQKTISCPSFGNKLSPRRKNNSMWSSSSSEPETPCQHGKISLRISESCLQSSAPVVGEDEEDDEVFVTDPQEEIFYGDPIIPPSPPPYPPPSLDDALLQEKTQKYLHSPSIPLGDHENEDNTTTHEKEIDRESYSHIDDEKLIPSVNMGNSRISTCAPIQNIVLPLTKTSCTMPVPHRIAANESASRNHEEDIANQQEETLSSISQPLANEIPTYESHGTLTSCNTNVMSPEDVKSQELAKEIVNKDKSLADILDPDSRMKTTMDLMSGLFTKSSTALKENNRKRKKERIMQDKTTSAENGKKEEKRETVENVINTSAYYTISAPKAELLKKIKDNQADVVVEEDKLDVNEKKAELITSLAHKLEVLKDAKESLVVDIKLNNSLGEEVEALIESLCKPNEFDKYKMFIGDLDKVVNLLLSLSGRLARVENVLSSLGEDTNPEERKTWNEKKKQLCSQHEDARELKENLDRREKLVMDILGNYLAGEQFQDYQHFVKMKSALLIEQRELDDKIKLGQEQLKCLLESLPSDFQIGGKVPLREGHISSMGNSNIPPPLTSSL
ncbi:protein Shroom3 [Pelodytes ibericus]